MEKYYYAPDGEEITEWQHNWLEIKDWLGGAAMMLAIVIGFIGLTLLGIQVTPGQGNNQPSCIQTHSDGTSTECSYKDYLAKHK